MNRRALLQLSLFTATFGLPAVAQVSGKRKRPPTAFVKVTVIPMDEDRVVKDQTVVVMDDRIVAVGPSAVTAVPNGAAIIDGRGKYLMPGLADMHVHIRDRSDLLLYIANGVTTVRSMNGSPRHLSWRRAISTGRTPGPAMVTAGPTLVSRQSRNPNIATVTNMEDVKNVIAAQKAAGYDFIKIHDHLRAGLLESVVRTAREHELPVVGHVPFSTNLDQAIAAGLHSIEHLSGFASFLQATGSPFQGAKRPQGLRERFQAFGHMDETRIDSVARTIRDAGIWSCPTLVAMERLMPGAYAKKYLDRPEMRHLAARYAKQWGGLRQGRRRRRRGRQLAWDPAAANRAHLMRLRLVGALHSSGAKLLLGTDAMAPFVVPGFAIHDELSHLVSAGLTPFEAFRAGTSDAAEFLGQSFGLVAPGQRADLVLLTANPLDAVDNFKRRAGVMVRGHWRTEAALASLLEQRLEKMATRRSRSRSR